MVGVAGRSKKCHTCRRRKVKCDQRRPGCGQCSKGARACEGYLRQRIFVNHFAQGPPLGSKDSATVKLKPGDAEAGPPFTYQSGSRTWVSAASPTQALEQDHLLAGLLYRCLPEGATQEVPLSWLWAVPLMGKETRCAQLALAALCYGWIGHANAAAEPVSGGLRLYDAAVRELRCALREDRSQHRSSLLATAELLTLYELFECGTESSNGWLAHLGGINNVLLSNGPAAYRKGPEHKMFCFFRTIGLVWAMNLRTRTFLASPEWCIVPWEAQGAGKNKFHTFLDLAVEAPGLLEEADRLLGIPGNQTTLEDAAGTADEVLEGILRLVSRMKSLERSEMSAAVGSPQTTLVSPRKFSGQQSQQHPALPRRWYPSMSPEPGVGFDFLQESRLRLLYNAILLQLLLTLMQNRLLRAKLSVLEPSQLGFLGVGQLMHGTDTAISMMQKEAEGLADHVSLWAEFCVQSTWQSFGPAIATFSLKTAVSWYTLQAPDAEIGMAAQPGDTSPFGKNYLLGHCLALLDNFRSKEEPAIPG